MIRLQFLITLLAFLSFTPAGLAQTSATKKDNPSKVISTTSVSVEVQSSAKLSRLENAKKELETELEQIKILKANAKTPCELNEADIREMDAKFLKDHAEQIQYVVDRIKAGLKSQLKMLYSFENGIIPDAPNTPDDKKTPIQDFTDATTGEKYQSTPLTFFMYDEEGNGLRKITVSVKALVQYIKSFEAAAAAIDDNDADAVESFLNLYRQPETEHNPKFFNMTLEQAKRAYAVLNTRFQVTGTQEQARFFNIGRGKHIFQVTTKTVLGYQPQYKSQVGTLKTIEEGAQKPRDRNTEIFMVQDYTKAYEAKEDQYWDIIRAQQITIDEVPLDGYTRRVYFNSKRSADCQNYDFKKDSKPGPFLSYDEKEACQNHGIEIFNAQLVTEGEDKSEVYDYTAELKKNADHLYQYTPTLTSLPIPIGMIKSNTRLKIEYRCGCNPKKQSFSQNQALSMNATICEWGCGSAVMDHLIAFNYAEIQSALARANQIYGPGVRLEILTINKGMTGYNPHLADPVVEKVQSNHKGSMDLSALDNVTITSVNSIAPDRRAYRFEYRFILPDNKGTIDPNSEDGVGLRCPNDQ